MINKYQIGELVEARTEQGIRQSRVSSIHALTKRINANKERIAHTIILEDVEVSYHLLNVPGKVQEKNIIRKLK